MSPCCHAHPLNCSCGRGFPLPPLAELGELGRRPFGGAESSMECGMLASPCPKRLWVPFQKPCDGMASGGRSMGLLVVALVTVVAVLGMVLFAVHKIRPRSLRFKAHVTRWLSLSLEIDSPQREIGGGRR
jgi:hypothetical protein